jgi:hypothetical protein
MLWPRAVIWERYNVYTAYPDYRDPRDDIWGIPNYVGGYEEWLVRAELLARERSALGASEAEGGILAEEEKVEVSPPLDHHSLSDLRGILTCPEEMVRSRRPPPWERRRNAGRGRGFAAASPPRHPDQRRGNGQQNFNDNNNNNNRDRGYGNSNTSYYRPPDDGYDDRN